MSALHKPRDSAINPHARRVCSSATSDSESSELRGAPHARAPQRSRCAAPTAAFERRGLLAQTFAAPQAENWIPAFAGMTTVVRK
ncbi:MAG: hypothetical protein IPJ08_14890 [Burkholderiales bacterium]|nr:hypothetical protein [Burkholderiales bacterium]